MPFRFGNSPGALGGVRPITVEEQAQKTKGGLFDSIFGDKDGPKADSKAPGVRKLQSRQDALRKLQMDSLRKGGIEGGLTSLGAALAQRFGRGKLDKAQGARKEELSALFGNLVKDPEMASALAGMSVQQQESVLGQLVSGKIGRGADLESYEAKKQIDQQYAAPPAPPTPPKPTDDAANFQFLQQLRDRGASEEDIQAFQQSAGMVGNPSAVDRYVEEPESRGAIDDYNASRRSPGTTVNVGDGPKLPKPPSGWSYMYNPDNTPILDESGVPKLAPITGGPEDPEVKAKADAKYARVQEENKANTRKAMTTQLGVIEGLLEKEGKGLLSVSPTSSVSGASGLLYSKIPGTPAHDFAASLDTVKANIGFDRLQRMREASKTGAAVGQLSNRELGLLTETLAPTRQGMSPARLKEALKVIRKMYSNPSILEDAISGEFTMPGQQPGNPGFDADLDALLGLGG